MDQFRRRRVTASWLMTLTLHISKKHIPIIRGELILRGGTRARGCGDYQAKMTELQNSLGRLDRYICLINSLAKWQKLFSMD